MKIFVCLVLLIILCFYISKTGLLIYGLGNAKKITFKNAHLFKEEFVGFRKLSSFRMERLLSDEEAYEIAERVKSKKNVWQYRNPAMSTLGTASYLDGSLKDVYIQKSKETNVFMSNTFGDLNAKVLKYFQDLCPESHIKFKKDAALPGFHIFHCNRLFSFPVASVHKDLQWQRLTFPKDSEIDMKYTMSFTLSLELPPGGAGLFIFDCPELGLLNVLNVGSMFHSLCKKEKVEYKIGYMVVHNGMDYHMIAPCKISEKYSRITLQGHGVYEKNANTWWLYW